MKNVWHGQGIDLSSDKYCVFGGVYRGSNYKLRRMNYAHIVQEK